MPQNLNILLLVDCPFEPDSGHDFKDEFKDKDWETEQAICSTLQDLGHTVTVLGLFKKLDPLFDIMTKGKPDLVFNLADVFNQKTHFDKNIAALLELFQVPYTGTSSDGLLICNNKALNKKILSYHRIPVPKFHTFYRGHKTRLIKRLQLPCIVKPLSEEASRGIAQASVVDSEEALLSRVQFIHDSMGLDAIAEEYIEGREFYVGILGHKKLTALPLREMSFGKMDGDEPRIATYKAKWDTDYRKHWRIKNTFATDLSLDLVQKAQDTCKRAYRALNLKSYARFDIRITPDEKIYIIESNANPSLEPNDEFALAAQRAGLSYDKMVERIVSLAINHAPGPNSSRKRNSL